MSLNLSILKLLIVINLNAAIVLSDSEPKEIFSKGLLIDTPGCSIPNINPFNAESLAHFTPHDTPYECPDKPTIFYYRVRDKVTPDLEILTKKYKVVNLFSVKFKGQVITRNDLNDSYQLSESEEFVVRIPSTNDFILIETQTLEKGSIWEYVSLFPEKKHLNERYEQATKESPLVEPLNMIVLNIGSISRLNFLRHFKKTYEYLKDALEAIELKGYSKISGDSFSNIVPLLTGQHYTKYWKHDVKSSVFFDECDFIWNHYKERGYRTLYAEDSSEHGTFTWNKRGKFKKQPTDYYYQPFAEAMENSEKYKSTKKFCYDAKLRIEVLWDYLGRFTNYVDTPYFAYSYVSDIVHENNNHAGYLDAPLLSLLTDLNEFYGVLNKSILILSSDHGLRVGKQRMTLTGAYEDRMPMAFMVFPKWFKTKYPDVYKNLKINENRLTTHFDMHSTLFHFLNFTTAPPTNKAYKHGISLFSEIPESRTCEDAGIDSHWCPCKLYVPSTDTSIMNQVADLALRQINNWDSKNENCAPLTIEKVIHFSSYEFSKKDDKSNSVKHFVDYLVNFLTEPGGGVFESTVRYDKTEDSYSVIDEMCRVNNYRPSKKCIENYEFLSIYCQCK